MAMETNVTQASVLETLRRHADELRAAGLVHLHLFGSVARNDHRFGSDVDLFADFSPDQKLTLITVGSLQQRLTHILHREVDLSTVAWMHEHVKARALAEAVLVF